MSMASIPTEAVQQAADKITTELRAITLYRSSLKPESAEEDARLNQQANELITNRVILNNELQSRKVQ